MKAENSTKFKFKVMLERRPIWGLILGLNVCVLVWLISVQEPVIFDVNTIALSSSSSSGSATNNYITSTNTAAAQEAPLPVAAALEQAQQPGSYGWGRDLLSNHLPDQNNDYDDNLPASVSTATTLNLNNNNNNSNNSNNNNLNKSTKTTKQAIFSHNFDDLVRTTTKTSDLSSNIQKLTSSPGTGVLDLKAQPTPSWLKLTAAASTLPADDFNRLIDLQNFRFLLPQPVCGRHIEALILVHSAPKNHEKRQVIRETWASISHHTAEYPLRVIFLLGAVNSEELQHDLQNENDVYRDMVQGSFMDDYRNMTYKHVMAFKWFLYNCPHAQILIKVDDDVYVNTPQLIKYLKEQQQSGRRTVVNNDNPTLATSEAVIMTPNKTKNTNNTTTTTSGSSDNSTAKNFYSIFHNLNIFATAPTSPQTPSAAAASLSTFNASQKLFNHPKDLLFCQKNIGALVKRSYRSKWRVSFKDYSERYYPPYCPGYAIIYSPDVIYRLYIAAQNSKYFWIDDVHITGVLAQQTNTTITTSSHYVLYSDECDKILTGKTDLSETEFLFAWDSISAQKIKYFWHLQMMSMQTLDQLHYKKNTMNDDDDDDDDDVVYEMPPPLSQHHNSLKRKRLAKNDGGYSSSYTYTSANGFR